MYLDFGQPAERTVKRIHENELVEVPKFVEGLHNNRYCETKGSQSYVNTLNILLHSTSANVCDWIMVLFPHNRGVVDLMFHYVLHLSEKWDVLW